MRLGWGFDNRKKHFCSKTKAYVLNVTCNVMHSAKLGDYELNERTLIYIASFFAMNVDKVEM